MYRPSKLLECAATILAGMLANPHIDPTTIHNDYFAKEAMEQAKILMEMADPHSKETIDDNA